jgi:hypothetical protein
LELAGKGRCSRRKIEMERPRQKSRFAAGASINVSWTVAEFEQHPGFDQSVGALHQRLIEQPDQACVEPVEAAHLGDQRISIGWHVGHLSRKTPQCPIFIDLVDFVNYLLDDAIHLEV